MLQCVTDNTIYSLANLHLLIFEPICCQTMRLRTGIWGAGVAGAAAAAVTGAAGAMGTHDLHRVTMIEYNTL